MKMGIAISGGANKGSWAQGVVTAITEVYGKGFSLVAGTSIGGIVGACLASSMSDDESWLLWSEMTWGTITNPRFPPIISGLAGSSFYSNKKMKKLIRKLFPRTFEELDRPLALTACDLMAGLGENHNIIMRSGDLTEALLATVAIPGIFPPIKSGNKFLIDGGIGNYIPLEIFKDFDLVFAVACGYGTPPVPPKTSIEIISRAFEMAVQEELVRELKGHNGDKPKIIPIINCRKEITQSSMMNWLEGYRWLQLGYEDGREAIRKLKL